MVNTTNNSIENVKLMEEINYLWFTPFTSRSDIAHSQLRISVLRKAFGVKNGESDKKPTQFVRNQIQSNEEIKSNFMDYVRFYTVSMKRKDGKTTEHLQAIQSFISAVNFFNPELANELKDITY